MLSPWFWHKKHASVARTSQPTRGLLHQDLWLFRPVGLGDVFVNVLVFRVAVLYYRIHQICLVHRSNFKEYRRHVLFEGVVRKGRGVELFLFGKLDRGFDGGVGKWDDRLVDGHGLPALGDVLQSFETGVLSGDEDLAGKLTFFESRDHAAGHAIVRGNEGLHIVVVSGQGILSEVQRQLRFPVGHKILCNDINFFFIYRRLQDLELRLFHNDGVVIGRGTVNHHVIAFRLMLKRIFGDLFADDRDLMRNIEVYLVGVYQPVIADDGHALGLCLIDHRGRLGCVVWRDYQSIDALRQQIVNVVGLFIGLVIGDCDHAIDIHRLAMGLKRIVVALPTLFL